MDGSHTVHRHGCPLLPESGRRILLGVFQLPQEAVKEGRRYFRRPGRCPFCSKVHNEKKKPVFTEVKTGPSFISSARMIKALWVNQIFCSLS